MAAPDADGVDPIAASADWESSGRSYVGALPIVFDRAEGPFLFDAAGRRYLDFLAGAGVLLLGHNHPAVRAAVAADTAPLVNGLDLLTTAKLAFVERLRGALPGDLATSHKVHFCGPTGSDAIEAALKLAALATGRRGVIAFAGSYHGMSQGALGVSSSRRLRRAGLLSAPPVTFCPYPYPLRFPEPYRTPEAASAFCLAHLRMMLEDDHSGVDLPGMILLEAVQGEGGTIVAPASFLQGVAELCERHGILLAVDEIQAGLGRTGRFFAFEHAGIQPDIIAVSKGIGGGYPMSMLLFHRRLDVMRPGDHIGTFRGQQIAFTAGRALLETIAAEQLLGNATRVGGILHEGLDRLSAGHPAVAEVRGIGLYLGVEMRASSSGTASEAAARVRDALLARGVVVEVGGREGAVVRLLPPLTTGPAEADQFLGAFGAALASLTPPVVIAGDDFRLLVNPSWRADQRWDAAPRPLPEAACRRAAADIAAWPGYAASPLLSLPGLARQLGVGGIAYQDEGGRFGVGSFKALGAPYALACLLAARLGRRLHRPITTRAIMTGAWRDACADFTAAAATDGNHGRALAWAARQAGCRCIIYVPPSVSPGRVAAIAAYSAQVTRIAGTYDDAVAHCTAQCRRNDWLEVTDTAPSSSADAPGLSSARRVMAGYTLIIDEALARMDAPPTHLFAQGGVGGFAAGAAARLWQRLGDSRVRLVVVEPHRAACLFASAEAGALRPASGDLDTIMQGLACGEASAPAWAILHQAAAAFLTIDEARAIEAMRVLAAGTPPLVAGETGGAGTAGLLAVAGHAAARAALALDTSSRVLLVGTEGATDPARYAEFVGHPPA